MRMIDYANRISDTTAKAAAMVDVLNIAASGESAIQEETLAWYTMVLSGLLDQVKADTDEVTRKAAASRMD